MRGIRCVALAVAVAAQPVHTGPALQPGPDTVADVSGPFEAAVRKAVPATVRVLVQSYGPVDALEDGGVLVGSSEVGGSGVIVDPDGYVITNEHVVRGAERVRVRLGSMDGWSGIATSTPELDARVVGVHVESDLALLKIDATDLPYLAPAAERPVRQGQIVFAIGSPCGLENTVTMGIVSTVRRQPEPDAPIAFIQTDASILPGNSGGALVDAEGHLVGINTAVLALDEGADGPGLAIPADVVEYVYRAVRERGRGPRADMGIAARTVTPALAHGLGFAPTTGVVVADVFPLGPAARAGLSTGDVIMAAGGAPVRDLPDLVMSLYRHEPSLPVDVTVWRDGQTLTLAVDVMHASEPDPGPYPVTFERRNLLEPVGAFATDVTRALARQLHLRSVRGALITALTADFHPVFDGLAVGDVIVAVNGTPVADVEAVRTVLGRAVNETVAVLHVERSGIYRYVVSERGAGPPWAAGPTLVRVPDAPIHAASRSGRARRTYTACPSGVGR